MGSLDHTPLAMTHISHTSSLSLWNSWLGSIPGISRGFLLSTDYTDRVGYFDDRQQGEQQGELCRYSNSYILAENPNKRVVITSLIVSIFETHKVFCLNTWHKTEHRIILILWSAKNSSGNMFTRDNDVQSNTVPTAHGSASSAPVLFVMLLMT